MGRFRITDRRFLTEDFFLAMKRWREGSFEDLASRVGMSRKTLLSYAYRWNRAPTEDSRLLQIANILNFPEDLIYERKDY
jgi:cyanate lyase